MSPQPAGNLESPLHRLARALGVGASHADFRGVHHAVPLAALEAIIDALGVRASNPDRALDELRRARWAELVEPVAVAWAGRGAFLVRTPARARDAVIEVDLENERGEHRSLSYRPGDTRIIERATIDGAERVARRVALPSLDAGYHTARVRLRTSGTTDEGTTLVLAAPQSAFRPATEPRAFGVFAPLYSLHSNRTVGIGDVGDLRRLLQWTRRSGGSAVGTLPLLATFHDDPQGVSPYAPISCLAWDELFLELEALPEVAGAESVRESLEAARAAAASSRSAQLVDYLAAERVRQPILEQLARHAFADTPRRAAIERFGAEHPEVERYARFRGARDHLGPSWHEWPQAQRAGELRTGDVNEVAYRTHLYAQFSMHEQLASLAAEARRDGGPGLYLDLPVGAHRAGFDTWRFPEALAAGLDTGAPPDAIFNGGQNWHFPPADPVGARRSGYRYFIESVRGHLRYAGVLRIDHVMAMHRIYVMPAGGAPAEGAYLHYPSDELWAILAIESHRARSVISGEDLGTVPAAVRTAMRRHGVGGSYVVQYEARRRAGAALPPPPPHAVASLNTHDMPTFSGWLTGADISAQEQLGRLDATAVQRQRGQRDSLLAALRHFLELPTTASDETLLATCIELLGRSAADLVLVALSDLLDERDPHNIPGTTTEVPNWRRRARLSLEEIERDPGARARLELLRDARAGGLRASAPGVGPLVSH